MTAVRFPTLSAMRQVRHTARMAQYEPLQSFDTTGEELLAEAYMTFIHDPHLTIDGFLAVAEDSETARICLEVLEARGLIDLPGDGTIVVPPPDLALNAHASSMESRARRVRATAPRLTTLHRVARQTDPNAGDIDAHVLRSVAEIRAATAEVVADAEHTIRTVRADSPRTRALLDPDGEHDAPSLDSTGNPLRTAAVYDQELLQLPGVFAVLRRRQRAGEEVRLARSLPFSAVVVDDRVAVIDLSNIDPNGEGSVSVHGGPLVQGIARFARRTFDEGLSLPAAREREEVADSHGLGERDLVILTLLAAGSSDAVTARSLGVSVRTVERRIRHIMDQLGTTSRLQTGLVVGRRGIL